MQEQVLTLNESIQFHELLTLNNLSLTKLITMSPLIEDDELKMMIKNNIKTTQEHIKELRGYLEQSKISSQSPKSK